MSEILKKNLENNFIEDKITISMEEYKELLIIKGRYEELKADKICHCLDKKPEYKIRNLDDMTITL